MLRIIMLSETIKGSPTSCCLIGQQKLAARGLSNVAKGWVGSYAITIKRRLKLADKYRTMLVRLRLGCAYAKADALLTTMMIAGETHELVTADLRACKIFLAGWLVFRRF
jgi:hypothetical protein